MKPFKDWNLFDMFAYICGLSVLAVIVLVGGTVVSTLVGMILAFASTGFGAIVLALVAYRIWKKWKEAKETKEVKENNQQ